MKSMYAICIVTKIINPRTCEKLVLLKVKVKGSKVSCLGRGKLFQNRQDRFGEWRPLFHLSVGDFHVS